MANRHQYRNIRKDWVIQIQLYKSPKNLTNIRSTLLCQLKFNWYPYPTWNSKFHCLNPQSNFGLWFTFPIFSGTTIPLGQINDFTISNYILKWMVSAKINFGIQGKRFQISPPQMKVNSSVLVPRKYSENKNLTINSILPYHTVLVV